MIRTALPRDCYAKWTEIDLDALRHNLGLIQTAVGAQVRVMGVVKANAYGHNVSLIAPALYAAGVRDFGVATLGEAIYLREVCPEAEQILILSALAQTQYRQVIAEGFEFIVHTLSHIPLIDELAQATGCTARVHLKVDTGMGRVGIMPAEVPAALSALERMQKLDLRGICSHLACSDEPDSEFVRQQLQRFDAVKAAFEAHPLAQRFAPSFHIANSDAVFQYPESHCDLVRPGISLYGYCGLPTAKLPAPLKPVLALKAQIAQFKQVPAGTPLGYGRSYVTTRPSRLAVIALGYADGLNRLLSNVQEVLVDGNRYPLVGRISMDQCVVDLTELPDWGEPGLKVVFIGQSGEQRITAQDWADKLDTIPYEILTSLGTRLPRYPIPVQP
ncbi:MAG: alanine racemase [Candidatus Melainabacteria bacterium HGW-Melainabacteria-1]|nr:MAG: alanine racemase [Candidatus Melainabacteria bacterium HGW-Melainabacteria-1]